MSNSKVLNQSDINKMFINGRELARTNRPQEAEGIFNTILLKDPNYLPAYDLLAYVLEMQERYEEAQVILNHLKVIRTVLANNSTEIIEAKFSDEDFNHPYSPKQDLNLLLSELNSLTGLKQVKYQINQLLRLAEIQRIRRERGLSDSPVVLHNIFIGNPGTGKTTVARLYGRLLKSIGLLSKGHSIETDRSGLVAEYIGQTEAKTNNIINQALGGVLFIDEAYSLYKGKSSERDFGIEAIQVLLKRMEDNRKDLAVIVAGYPRPMKEFLNANEGLSSRFPNTIEFEDYSPDELIDILKDLCKEKDYVLTREAMEETFKLISSELKNKNEHFGNARFVRNLFEAAIKNQAFRLGESDIELITNSELMKILPEDIK